MSYYSCCQVIQNLTLRPNLSGRTQGIIRCPRTKPLPAQGLERFTNLVTLSLGSVNLTSLTNFPQLPKLQNLLLSDNNIAGGLEALTAAKLDQLTELDLSNNKFASLPSFKPLAGLRSLKALHVEANPAEKTVKDLRQSLFKMMAALQYVDNVDPFGKGRSSLQYQCITTCSGGWSESCLPCRETYL